MGAQNKVIKGDYKDHSVLYYGSTITFNLGLLPSVRLKKNLIKSYDVMDEKSSKSATSAVGRAAVGAWDRSSN